MPKIPFKQFMQRLKDRGSVVGGKYARQKELFPEVPKKQEMRAKALGRTYRSWYSAERSIRLENAAGEFMGSLDYYDWRGLTDDQIQQEFARHHHGSDRTFQAIMRAVHRMHGKQEYEGAPRLKNAILIGSFDVDEKYRTGNGAHEALYKAFKKMKLEKPTIVFFQASFQGRRIKDGPGKIVNNYVPNKALIRFYRSLGFNMIPPERGESTTWGYQVFE